MYIKFKNNKITEWADWEFEGSTYIETDYEDYSKNPDKFKFENGVLVDLSNTQSYQNKQRIKNINEELQTLDELYYSASQAPIEFEGHTYKFEWTTLYQGLLNSGILPAKIWDMTELEENAVVMDEEQLQNLQNYLLSFQESAFQTRKEAKSLLLSEKYELEKLIEE